MSILDDSLSHLETNTVDHPSAKKGRFTKGKKPFVFGALALVVVLGVFVSVKLTQTEQDISNQAATDQGQVLVTGVANGALAVGQPVVVTLKANTQGVNIDGIQLTFTINTSQSQALTTAPTASVVTSSGINLIASTINPIQNGMYQVVLLMIPPSPDQHFSSTTPKDFATVTFTPTGSGTISFQFDNVASYSLTATTNVDTLHTIQPMNFSVASTTSPTVTPHGDPSNTPILSATATPTGGTCNSILVKNASTGSINNSPRRGDTLQFECGQINGAARYQFQTKGPGDSVFVQLPAASNGARISQNYPITQAGDFVAQCRMCTGTAESTCQAWE